MMLTPCRDSWGVAEKGDLPMFERRETKTMYAIQRKDMWLTKSRSGWSVCESQRGLWGSKAAALAALGREDRVGLDPQDPLQIAIQSTETYVVAVSVYTVIDERNGEREPVLVKVKPFKHRYFPTADDRDKRMGKYYTEGTPKA